MADDFDLTGYLNSRADFDTSAVDQFRATRPIVHEGATSLDLIGSEKRINLDAINAAKKTNLENAWVDKRGLDADGIVGYGVNLLASGVSGVANVGKFLGTLPLNAVATAGQASVPNDVIDAYSRIQSGEEEDGDQALVDQLAADTGTQFPQTYAERLSQVDHARQWSKNISDALDLSKIVNSERRDEFRGDLGAATAGGLKQIRAGVDDIENERYGDAALNILGGVVRTVGNALVTGAANPLTVGEYAVENLPQLAAYAVSAPLGVATNVGYAADELREGYTDYQRDHAGALPEAEDRVKMSLFAASAALAETIGDASMLKGLMRTADTKGARKAAVGVASAMSREGVTEGYQTFAEGKAHLTDASLEEIVEAATIGAFVGGTYHGAAELGSAGKGIEATIEESQAVQEAFTAAVESGNVDALADYTRPTYNPVRAVQALQEIAKGGDEAQVQESIRKSDEIQQELAKQVTQAEVFLDTYSPEAIADLEQYRDDQVAAGADQARIDVIEKGLEDAQAVTPEVRQKVEQRLEKLRTQLDETRTAAEQLQIDTSPDAETVDNLVQQAQAGDTQATDRLLTLTMVNPEAIDPAVLETLAESPSLTESQRRAIRTFTEAQVAANSLKGVEGVRSEIATGGDGFKGLSQYRNAIRMALANGNMDAARSQVDGIAAFAASQQSKAEAITAAYEQVKGTGNRINLVRNESGVWEQTSLTDQALKEAGGLYVDGTSFKVRDAVTQEAEVLAKTAEAFAALVDAAPQPAPAVAEQAAPVEPVAEVEQEAQPAPVEPVAQPVVEEPTSNVNEAAPVEETQPTTVQETGELTAIRNKPQEEVSATNYRKLNLVGALFTQEAGKDNDASARPLVSAKDFAAAYAKNPAIVYDYLAQRTELTGPQKTAVTRFFAFNKWADAAIREQFKAKNPEFRFTDFAQFLVNDDGSIDSNVATSIAFAIFTWVNENATQIRNTDASINAILMRDGSTEPSNAEQRALSLIGARESAVSAQLGGRIAQALGIRANPNATESEVAKLESSLGQRAVNALVKLGLAERPRLTDATLQKLMRSGVEPNPRGVHNFVRIKSEVVDGRRVGVQLVRQVREANVGSQSVLSKLFGVEAAGVEPSYTPVPFDQTYAKRTKQHVPKILAQILEAEGKKPHVVRQDMFQVWGSLSQAAQEEIAGVVSETDTPTHVENRDSRVAKNDGLKQQVENFNTFVNKMVNDPATNGLEQELFFGRSVWKPQRVGLSANVINPQTSKVHRHLIKMAGWGSTVDMSNNVSLNNFKLRVMEAFDIKTEAKETVDVLKGYADAINRQGVQDAVEVLAEQLRGETTDTVAFEQKVLAGVRATGNAVHGLDALVALAHQRNAERNGDTKFQSELMGEVDGVTNGPMLSLLMLGAKGFEILSQGGFFRIGQLNNRGDQLTQFNDFHAMNGNLDLYESTIAAVLRRLTKSDSNLRAMTALETITGALQDADGNVTSKGRKIIKQPLTAMMFGSNTRRAAQGMADGFIESIYSKMEDMAADRDEAGMKKVLEAVNVLIGKKAKGVNTQIGVEGALNMSLTNDQAEAIKLTFYELLGNPTELALADTYQTFLARRDTVNQSAQLAFKLYTAVEDAVTAQVMRETGAGPTRKRDGVEQPLRSLTKAQQARVQEIMGDISPVLQTALSQASDQPSAGMYMAKSRRRLDSSEPYVSEVSFGAPVETIAPDGTILTGENAPKSTVISGMRTEWQDPGVMPFITSIHSLDSFIASSVYSIMEALNVHDALGVDLDNVGKVGQELNKATFQGMLNYSAPTAMVEMLEKTLVGVEKLAANPAYAADIKVAMEAIIADMVNRADRDKRRGNVPGPTSFADALAAMRHVATQADTDKLSMLAEMAAIGQYATEGGSYEVSTADRAAATKALSEIGSTFNAEAETAAESLYGMTSFRQADHSSLKNTELSSESVQTLAPATTLNAIEEAKVTANEQLITDLDTVAQAMVEGNRTLASAKGVLPAERAADVIEAVNNVTAKPSVWGKLGTPVLASDPNLIEMLEGTELNAQQLAHALGEYTSNRFTKALLGMIRRGVGNLPVRLITSETGPEGAFGVGVDKSRGWYAQQGNREAIFVKNTEFVESGINEEMLVHELVHATLGVLVDQHDGANTAIGREVARLNDLLNRTQEFVSNNGAISAKFGQAVKNVHELIAWGLTNQEFQMEVLAKVQAPASRGRLLDGLKAFIDTLTGILFNGDKSKANTTGLGLLIATSTGLFRAAAQQREAQAKKDGLTLNYEDDVNHINAMTAGQVFDALATVSPNKPSAAHTAVLRNLLNDVVNPVYGPYGAFKEQASANRTMSPMDVYLQALNTNQRPFASAATTHEFIVSEQEAFVLESVEATFLEAINNPRTLFVRTAVESLFNTAKTKLKPLNFHPGDWSLATPQEKAEAEAKYRFIFGSAMGIGSRSNYLARFAALGLASEEVRNVLTFATPNLNQPLGSLPFASRLVEILRRMMTGLSGLYTKTYPGQRAGAALETLVNQLVTIEAKRKDRLNKSKVNVLDQMEMALGNAGEKAREAADNLGKSKFFRNSSSPLVKLAGVTISTLAADRLDAVLGALTQVRDKALKGQQHGTLMGLVNEARGSHDGNRVATELFKQAKQNEQLRKNQIEYTAAQTMAAFKDGGSYLTQADKKALTKVFLRTGAAELHAAVGMDEFRNLMNDPAAMKAHRAELVKQLKGATPEWRYMMNQVKDLAHHKVFGGSTSDMLMLNTLNIADLVKTKKAVLSSQAAVIKPLLDQLLPIYALEYSGQFDKQLALEVLRTESNRGNLNGIDFVLKLHKGLMDKSTEFLFKGTERLQSSAYVPEIVDNNIEVLLVDRSARDAHEKAGYVIAGNLQYDPAAGFKDGRTMMTRRGSGQTSLLTGAMSYTGMGRRGTRPDLETLNMLQGTQVTSAGYRNQIEKAKEPLIDALFDRPEDYDPRKVEANKLVPVMGPNGDFADWRYMMTEKNRDVLLDRDSSFDQVLGVFSGQIVDKVSTTTQNADVIRSLHDQFRADFKNRPSSYILVGKHSADPKLAELWRLLPEPAKIEMRKVWRQDGMMIPADQINLIMGYRKYSLTEPFSADPAERNVAEKLFVNVSKYFLNEKAALKIGKAEDVIQELVRETKDILVVKNIVTLVGNMMSNLTLLAWEGVPLHRAIASHAIGIKAAVDYRRDNKRLTQLVQAVDIGYLPEGADVVDQEIGELRDRLARNPLKPLIDAGLMPTIVEDVEADDSQYSYKSRLQRKVEKYTSKVPSALRTVGKNVYMTHDTGVYKFLSQATQLSDLVARYTMFEHSINRKRDPLSVSDALRQAEDSFVNYDLPSHRTIQFMNDMGVVMFTKYYMRIQKTIMRLIREKPLRGLMLAAANHYVSGLESIADSHWMNRIGGNPFQDSAFGYVGALDELPAIKLIW